MVTQLPIFRKIINTRSCPGEIPLEIAGVPLALVKSCKAGILQSKIISRGDGIISLI